MDTLVVSPSVLNNISVCQCYEARDIEDEYREQGKVMHEAVYNDSVNLDSLTERQQEGVESAKRMFESYKSFTKEIEKRLECTLSDLLEDYIVKIIGRIDLLITHREKCYEVIDWKFGESEIPPPKDNFQLMCYALLVFEQLKATQVTTTIVAPLQESKMVSHLWHTSDIPYLKGRISQLLMLYKRPDKTPTLNWAVCRYCKQLATCPAAMAMGYQLVKALSTEEVKDLVTVEGQLTPEVRGKRQRIAKILESLAKAIREENTEAAIRGERIEGFRLVRRAGNLSIIDNRLAIATLLERIPNLKNYLDLCVVLKVPDLIKQLASNEGGDQRVWREKLKEILGSNIVEGEQVVMLRAEKSEE